MKKKPLSLNLKLTIVLTVVMLISLLVGLIISAQSNSVLTKTIAETKEAARPADIEIITIADPSCADCFSLKPLMEAVKKQNVFVKGEEQLLLSDDKAQKLIKQYNLTKVPVMLVKGEVNKDKTLKDFWSKLGKIEKDTFILTQIAAPHVLTGTGEVKGLVNLTILTDKNCSECYQANVHERALGSLGISPKEKETIDVQSAEGRALIKKYEIKSAPTIILTGDLNSYPSFFGIWSQVGTVEEDGAHVFRNSKKTMGVYKDLSAGEIVKPAPPAKN